VNGSESTKDPDPKTGKNEQVWSPPKKCDVIKNLNDIHRSIIEALHKKTFKTTSSDHPTSALNRLLTRPLMNNHVSKQVAQYNVVICYTDIEKFCKVSISSPYIKKQSTTFLTQRILLRSVITIMWVNHPMVKWKYMVIIYT
jgi:hypothetical protein